MSDRFFSPGVSTSELAAMGERRSALTELKRQESFIKKPKALAAFLKEVWSVLEPYNRAGNTSIAQLPGLKPPGAAFALYKAQMDDSNGLVELVARHNPNGLKKVYLAAMYMTMRDDDQGAIRYLQEMLRGLESAKKSTLNKKIASIPRSPFIALVIDLLKKNRNEETEDLWQRLEGYSSYQFEFNGRPVEISVVFDRENEPFKTPDKDPTNPLDRRTAHWDTGDKHGSQLRRSFDSLISKLRDDHGLFKDM